MVQKKKVKEKKLQLKKKKAEKLFQLHENIKYKISTHILFPHYIDFPQDSIQL